MKPLVLIFGESPNDAKALRHIVPALLPSDKAVDCRPIREPGTMSRSADPKKRKAVAKAIAIKAAHEAKKRKVAVVAHEDTDAVEDAHVEQARQIISELTQYGIALPVAAVAAWEIEAWWLLFPEALANCRPCWAKINIGNRAVGQIENAKEFLESSLRPKEKAKGKCPGYSESDSERIAEIILQMRLCDDGRLSRSRSLTAFRESLSQALA